MKYEEAKQRLLEELNKPIPGGRKKISSNAEIESIEYYPSTNTLNIIERWVDSGEPLKKGD